MTVPDRSTTIADGIQEPLLDLGGGTGVPPDPDNQPPTASPDSVTTSEDTAVTIAVLDNDDDPDGDSLNITSVGNPPNGSAVINAGSSVTYTPDLNYDGTDAFDYTISDGSGGTATATVTVQSVNDQPVAN
ncbi:MAG: Ig-like domain-containing protein [Actinobacteria bacterium]|nr:Ig-like domain-containing protein [Actinomycetota bacterium]